MNIGIVSFWRNMGQGTLSRHLRDALAALGHQTFVLARPTPDYHPLPGAVERDDVWRQDGVEQASAFEIPREEYLEFARRHSLDAVFCNQNYQYGPLAALRRAGVRTIGYFVWESFREKDAAGAREAYDCIYSLNRCTQERYGRLGIASPLLFWGLHPELLAVPAERRGGGVWFFFPGGLQGPRKPLAAVVAAFRRLRDPRARLLLKAQLAGAEAEEADTSADPRIVRITDDLDAAAYYRLFASADVCLGVSRWEGTGLHFFEATAFGLPMITNDVPPMNEMFRSGINARLVRSHVVGRTRSGIPSVDPDVPDLAAAIEELLDDGRRAELSAGALELRGRMPWDRTVRELGELLR